MPDLAVDIQHVTHRYGEHVALQDVSLHVEAGALTGLLGPNGSGKTTLFRILSTLMPPSEGRAAVYGHDTAARPADVRRRLGVVFQEPALDEALSVEENLRLHAALYGLPRHVARARIAALLEQFDLSDRGADRVETLSGGLRRRADLARGLLHRPAVLLLDEPTSGLDPVARRTFWQHLGRLRRAEGTTLLVATHLMDEAERCDHVAILDRGRLVAAGAPADLKAALGDETLWLETPDPAALREHVRDQFGVEARLIGGAVQIAHPEAPALLAALYEALGERITSATVRRPTLDDVFMVHAGYRPDDPTAGQPHVQPDAQPHVQPHTCAGEQPAASLSSSAT